MSNIGNKRIAKNSGLLYFRMLFTMWLNLYATRLVMQNLGIDDFGVYGVVGGVVSLFSVLNGGISKAIQRFITFEIGKTDGNVNKVFCTLLNVTFIFSVFTFIFLEFVGLWFLESYINIPDESRNVAFWVYQFSVAASIFSLISNPYNALIIAHEKMGAFAFITIIECVLKLCVAFCLVFFSSRLFWYSLLLLFISIGIRLFYQIYCRRSFPESKYHFIFEKKILFEAGRFTGLATLDSAMNVAILKSIIWIINICFGPAVNAAYSISNQVKNSVLGFAQNIQKAIDPQLTKSYAAGDYDRHRKLVYSGSKIQVFFIYLIVLPFLVRTDQIMELWLGNNIPPYLTFFVRLTVLESVILSGFEVVRTSIIATGKIKNFVLIPNFVFFTSVPAMYFVGIYTHSPVYSMFALFVIYTISYIVRLIVASRECVFELKFFLTKTFLPSAEVGILSFLVITYIDNFLPNDFIGLSFFVMISVVVILLGAFFIGINKYERKIAIDFITSFISKIRK